MRPVLPDFRLETHFARWEFVAEHHLTASDAESMSMRDLLEMGTPEQRASFDDFWLGYTETWGAPDLREAVAATFAGRTAADILCFAGASEGIFAANHVLLDADSVTLEPCVDCRPTGRLTDTTYGDEGALPLSVAPITPPLSTPDPPSVALSLERLTPPDDTESELADTPSAAPITDLSSPTLVELLTARLSVEPYVPCSAVGTDTTT